MLARASVIRMEHATDDDTDSRTGAPLFRLLRLLKLLFTVVLLALSLWQAVGGAV